MKRAFALAMSFTLVLSLSPKPDRDVLLTAYAAQSGQFGENVTWILEDDTLTLSGSGVTGKGSLLPIVEPPTGLDADTLDQWTNGAWANVLDSVKHIVVGEGITGIDYQAFMFFNQLETVTLPDSLEEIGYWAFAGCPKLHDVQMPADVKIVATAFDWDIALYNPEKPFFVANDMLIKYGGNSEANIVIPDEVTEILADVFSNHTELETVQLPEHLTKIGSTAFYGCDNLQEITLPESLTQIGYGAFWKCSSLQEIDLPEGIKQIESYTFADCENLRTVTVPKHVQLIGESAFQNCTSLLKILLPEAVTEIGDYAFQNCTLLSSITMPKTVTHIGKQAFAGCTSLQKKAVNGYVLVDSTALAAYIGKGHALHIPAGTSIIADEILYESGNGNRDVIAVICPSSLRFIGNGAFRNCVLLTELILNDGLQTIGENALTDCKSLTKLVIPASVTEIGAQANCSLTDIYGTPGTAAEKFAKENGIAFHDVNEFQSQGNDLTIDYSEDGWHFGNSGEVFGKAYYLSDTDRQYLADLGIDASKFDDKIWSGSCGGLSITVILAKNRFFSPSQLQSGAYVLSDIDASEDIQSLINYYQCMINQIAVAQPAETSAQTIWRMQNIAKNIPNGESPFLLTFKTGSGGFHAVVGYGYESGYWMFEGKTYDSRILTWDSNFPDALNDTSCVYFDSETFDYCIPYYNVYIDDSTSDGVNGINTVCNDLAILNAHPYPFSLHYDTGDLNLDGTVSIADVVFLSKYLTTQMPLSESQKQFADLSGDGKLNAVDLTLLKRRILL